MRFGFKVRRPGKGRTTRRIPGTMNKTEARYENEVLKPLLLSGEIIGYSFEDTTFKLADDLRYTPDFSVQLPDGTMEFHEVKAGLKSGKPLCEEDAKIKIKIAADKLQYKFVMRWYSKDAGVWLKREF